jgi:PAS domain-containing protein
MRAKAESLGAISAILAQPLACGPGTDGELRAALDGARQLSETFAACLDALGAQCASDAATFLLAEEAYLVTDRMGAIRDSNDAACRLFGAAARVLRRRPLIVYVASAERREFRNHLASLRPAVRSLEWDSGIQPARQEPLRARFRVRVMPGPPRRLGWLIQRIAPLASLP